MIVGILTLIFIAGASAGYSTLFLSRKDYNNLTDYVVFSIALGGGFIGGLTLVFAALKYINLHFFITVVVIGNALLVRNRSSFKFYKVKKRTCIFFIIVIVFLLVNFFYSLFPPTFYDSMMYHLAVPNYYMLHGGITSWETNFNSSLPLNGEMLFLFSLLSGTIFTPKLLSFFSGVLIIFLMSSWYINGFQGKRYLLPAILFLTVPQISFLMSSSKTDIIGMLFMIFGIRSFFYYLDKGKAKNFLILSGVFWGLAVGTKYIFAFYLAGFLISLLFLPGEELKVKFRAIVKISVIVLLCLSPWFGKNIVLNGNPVYPYMNKYFGNNNWDQFQQETFSTIIKRGSGKTLGDYLRFPLKVFTTPYSYGITAVWGFMFLLLLPFSIFHGNRRGGRLLFFTSFLAFVFMIPFAMVPRYFLASLLLVSIPASLGIEKGISKFDSLRKLIIPLIITISALNLILLINLQEKFFHGFSYLSKKYSGEYAGKKLKYLYALPYYGGVEYINDHLSESDKVIFLGEDRTFYMKKMFMASSFNDRNVLIDILKRSESFSDFKKGLWSQGITHIFYSPAGLERMGRISFIYRIGPELKIRLENYLHELTILYRDKSYILYRIGKYYNE